MNNRSIVIAIDGYSSSGKSTMAKSLARKIGYRYIDSGAMYRATTLYAMQHGMIDKNGVVNVERLVNSLDKININFLVKDNNQFTLLNGENVEDEIRQLPVSENVSAVAAIPAVRHKLVKLQQELGTAGAIIMDGRDIGTTVFPDAELKIFVNAPAETRAQRRYKELTDKGQKVTFEEILENVKKRDHIDETREESPLRRASDAIDFDNSSMTLEQQDAELMFLVEKAIGKIV